jgi:2-polyprenyl-3-methyl-5-hydroxy-6-metoxy-1,4-benzoquinol methylase
MIPAHEGRLLEIGCAGGFFLDEARKAGFDVVGAELNPEMAAIARDKLSLTVHEGMFETLGFAPESFDVIVAQDVLEHIRDPNTFVGHVAGLLKPHGLFFVRGPLEASMRESIYAAVRKICGRRTRTVEEPPFHLQGFCQTSFTNVLTRAGLVLETFVPTATAPNWNFANPKNGLASLIEHAAFCADTLRGKGSFMTAIGRKPSAH